MKKDFSQHKESTWIKNYITQNKLDIPKLFVDIGAHDGITNSNSRLFAMEGWKTLYFEPNPITFSKLINNTIGQNREIYNIAISDKIQKNKFEIVMKKNFEGHSKINNNGKHTVLSMPLDYFIDKYEKIGILDIDAEGHDNIIAKSIIEKNLRPYIMIVESNSSEMLSELKSLLSPYYTYLITIKVNSIWLLKHS